MYDTLIGHIEAGDFQAAYVELNKLYKDSQGSAEDTTANTKQIEITSDNWQEYFEFKLTPSEEKNAFGELEIFYVSGVFSLKQEYADILVDMNVPVEFKCTEGYKCRFSLNRETGEVSEVERVQGYYATPEETGTFTLTKNTKKQNLFGGVHRDTLVVDGNVATIVGQNYAKTEIVRIQGSITVKD